MTTLPSAIDKDRAAVRFKRLGDPDTVFNDAADVDVIVNVLDHVKKTAVPPSDAEVS